MRAKPRQPPGGATASGGKAPQPLNIREHILDRTIYLMGKQGTTDVSIRAIAREAGVNVAAVNYYFSSKEQMLAQLGERFRLGFQEVMRVLANRELSAEERLRRWVAEVMRYIVEYPGILGLMERQMAAEPLDPFGEALRAAVQRATRQLKATLRELVGPGDEARLGFKLTLLISSLAGPFPRQAEAGRFKAPAQRSRFLDLLLEHLRR